MAPKLTFDGDTADLLAHLRGDPHALRRPQAAVDGKLHHASILTGAVVPSNHTSYDSLMAAKVSPRVRQIVEEAAELGPDELAELIEAIKSLPRREEVVAERPAVIAERVARVQAGGAPTLSVEEVEASLRRDLDF